MTQNRNKNSENKPPNNNFQKILFILGFLVILVVFVGGVATTLVILNWKKIFGDISLTPNVNPLPTASSSPTPSSTVVPLPSPSPSPTESSSPSPSPTESSLPSPSSAPEIKSPISAIEQQDISFELLGCQKSTTDTTAQRIQCSLNIISTRENARVSLYPNSNELRRTRIFDTGNENIATQVEFGSNTGPYSVSNNLIKDVALKAIFSFNRVPIEVNKIEVLEISSYLESSYYQGDIKIEFRNVPLSNP
ncbi:hypothetical protein WA1_11585 [Scytonema hofmannii PCC 7110]|uniref:Uncharacterized protein n=1 Tax=Scytonema hofmannii PCC 7110 TaxID=128403 RepID=A0A139XDJ5_9CYAN|nr:hypothetical protein [Scytonema hofmannii]KYC42770.1 hypothetical protein WA1_11585 [Scytonema hofmannii PCC 7110]